MMDVNPLVQVKTVSEMVSEEAEQTETKKAFEVITSLSRYVDKKWADAKKAKETIEDEMLQSLKQKRGEYDAEKLQAIKDAEQPEIFMNITETKCSNAVAWIKDILMAGDRIFGVDPTPVPELPPEVVEKVQQGVLQRYIQMFAQQAQATGQIIPGDMMRQMIMQSADEIKDEVTVEINRVAKKFADKIADKIDDDWVEGGFYKALERFIDDLVQCKAGIIKGIVFRKKKVKRSVVGADGRIQRVVESVVVPTYERRSPFCIYPSPKSTGIDSGDLFDVLSLRPRQLYDMIGIEGYSEKDIRNVLREFNAGELTNEWIGLSDSAKEGIGEDDANRSTSQYPDENIYALELWSDVPGNLLSEWGLKVEDKDAEYSCSVIKIGNYIISARLNYDDLGRKPYAKASFRETNDSFWGLDLPMIISACQQVCNACARSILSNIGIGALPQTVLNIDRLQPGASKKVFCGKVWEVTEEQMASGEKPIDFFTPPMVTEKLMNVYTTFSRIADEHSGVPAYSHGSERVGGAGNALADYEKILTPHGLKEIYKLKCGDVVYNTYGSTSKVTGVYPQDGERDIYRISFSDNSTIDCDSNHIWSLINHHGNECIETTASLIKKGICRKVKSVKNSGKTLYKWHLPKVAPVEFKDNKLKIDPYTMGLLIGDGCVHGHMVSLTVNDTEVDDILKKIPYDVSISAKGINSGKSTEIHIRGIRKEYAFYGLDQVKASTKFIPEDYLYSSLNDRIELLRGLMDSDGSVDKRGNCVFSTTSEKLLDNLKFLVNSLGGRIKKGCKVNGCIRQFPNDREYLCKDNYYINFVVPYDTISYLKKKQTRYIKKPVRNIYIKNIASIGKSTATCISVDSKNSLYVCGNFIPTHNTSSGLHQLVVMASRGIRAVIRNIDKHVIVPCLERHYDYLLDNYEIYGLIGDYKMNAKGTDNLIKKEQVAQRKIEFIAQTSNPVDIQLVGAQNRRKMLFEVAKSFGIDIDEKEIQPIGNMQLSAPPEKPATLDAAGNQVVGTEDREFNQGEK